MLPPAPDLFSTTNGTPNFACRCCCRMRASKSADPPAANGTTMMTGRCGQASCACAGAAAAKTRAAARVGANIRRMPILQQCGSARRPRERGDPDSRAGGYGSPPARGRQVYVRINRDSHCLEMGIAPLVEVLVGVAHGLGLAASEHDLEVDRLEAVVLIAVDDAGGTRDAFPRRETGGEAFAALVLDKDVEIALEHEETL